MDQSPRLSLCYLMPAQAQKHVTVNETFRRLDQLVQQTVLSRTVAAEPGAPNDGDAYILPASPTGTVWSTFSQNNIAAYQDGAWTQISAAEGFSAWVADTDEFIIYDGAAWNTVSGSGSETAAKFGVNTTADATNKLAVKSNAVLFDALDVAESGTGDSLVKVNKEAVADTASHLFQTAFSGRAEFGLTGDDDFHVKVSANGSAWTEAITIDKDNGFVGINNTAPAQRLEIGLNSGDEIRFAWASSTNGLIAFQNLAGATNQSTFAFNCRGNSEARLGLQGWNDSYGFVRNICFFNHSGGLEWGAPTGGDKGAGAINAQAVYDDNTLLTCYVFDQALDGVIDDAKWDGKVPDRIIPATTDINKNTGKEHVIKPEETIVRTHEPMRKFRARIGAAEDPLTLDGYAKHWRQKRHLTSMPNEAAFDPANGLSSGEWIQRLVETVEIQAVLIEQLNQRVKVIETAKPAR